MGHKLPPDQVALYQAIDEIIFFDWDPIGVRDFADCARDEYYTYLPRIFSIALTGDRELIADHLHEISDQNMCCPMRREHHLRIADRILEVHGRIKSGVGAANDDV